MINIIKSAFYLDISMSVNIFLYYFKRIPLLGKIFSDKIYQELSIKKIISYLVFIIKVFRGFAAYALYILLALYLPSVLLYKNPIQGNNFSAFVHLFFILSIVIEGFIFSETFEPSRKKLIAIRLLHFPLRNYIVAHIIYKIVCTFIYSVPVLIIFTLILKGTIIQALLLSLLATFAKSIGEAFHILLYHKTKWIIKNHTFIFVTLVGLFLAIAYLPIIFKFSLPTERILFSIPSIIFIVILGIISIRYILNYTNYSKIFCTIHNTEKLTID